VSDYINATTRNYPMSFSDFTECLVRNEIIDRDAIEDSEGYDCGVTLSNCMAAHADIFND